MSPTTTRSSFVVRVARDRDGRLTGVVGRVATGAKEPFSGVETIGGVIGRMTRRMSTTSRDSTTRAALRSFDRRAGRRSE